MTSLYYQHVRHLLASYYFEYQMGLELQLRISPYCSMFLIYRYLN